MSLLVLQSSCRQRTGVSAGGSSITVAGVGEIGNRAELLDRLSIVRRCRTALGVD